MFFERIKGAIHNPNIRTVNIRLVQLPQISTNNYEDTQFFGLFCFLCLAICKYKHAHVHKYTHTYESTSIICLFIYNRRSILMCMCMCVCISIHKHVWRNKKTFLLAARNLYKSLKHSLPCTCFLAYILMYVCMYIRLFICVCPIV